MGKAMDLSGQTFGRLYALRRVKTEKGARWFCFCSCGGRALVPTGALRKGTTKSCGCLRREKFAEARAERDRKKRDKMERGGEESPSRGRQDTADALDHADALADAVSSIGVRSFSD